tara:strand:+ start:891 stop:1469 length:579 start_codon:yes stop_codon:yes gene_type:complete
MPSDLQVDNIKDKSATKTLATLSSSAVTLHSDVTFPAGTIINYKFVQIGVAELSGTYTRFNVLSAATSTQGLQVLTTSFTPKSDNSKIFCQAQLFVQEDNNNTDLAIAALFVDTTNLSQQQNNDRSITGNFEHVVATLSGEFTNSSTTAKTIQIRASAGNNTPVNINITNLYTAVITDQYVRSGLSIFEVQQ